MAIAALGSKIRGVEDIDPWVVVHHDPTISRPEDDYEFSTSCMSAPNGADLATNAPSPEPTHEAPQTTISVGVSSRDTHDIVETAEIKVVSQ